MMLKNLSKFHRRFHKTLVFIFLVFTVFMINSAKNIEIQANMEKMIPQDLEVLKVNNIIRDKFGGSDFLVITLKVENCEGCVKDIREKEVLAYIARLSKKIAEEPEVGNVENIFTNPNAVDSSFSRTYIRVQTNVGADEKKIKDLVERIEEDINSIPKPSGLEVDLTGTIMIRKELLDLLIEDGKRVILIAYILIIIALILTLNSLREGVLPLISVTLAIIWTAGTMNLLGIPVSIMAVGIAPMLLGLGIDYSIHVIHRIRENFDEGLPMVSRAIITTSITTMLGFASLVFASMPGLRDFGTLGVIGIFYSMIAAIFLLPSLYLALPKEKREIKHFFVFPVSIVEHKKALILILIILLALFSHGFKGIKMESSPEKTLPKSDVVKKMWEIRDYFGGGDVLICLVEADKIDYRAIKEIEILEQAFMSEEHVIRVFSISDYIKFMNIDPRDEDALYKSGFISDDKRYTFIVIDTDVGSEGKKIRELISNLERIYVEKASYINIYFAGPLAVSYETFKLMMKDFSRVTILAIIFVFTFLIINFRSLKTIFLLMLPLAIALYFTFATIGMLRIPIRPETVGLASTILGIGIDYAILITYRFFEEKSVKMALEKSYRSILSSATTTIAGFSSLTFASLVGLKNMGASMAIGIFYCAVVALIFYPAILSIIMEKQNEMRM